MSECNTVSLEFPQGFPTTPSTQTRAESSTSVQHLFCMLSSHTSSVQSSAMKTAAHATNSPLWFVILPCAFKAKIVFAVAFRAKAIPTVASPCGMRSRPSKPQVVCRLPSVCTTSLGSPHPPGSSSLVSSQFHHFRIQTLLSNFSASF